MTDVTGSSTGERIVTNVSTTSAELPAPGGIAAAPVAPASGPTGVPAGTPVVVVGVHFWDHPTIKAIRNVVALALTAGFIVIANKVIANGTIFGLDWTGTLHVGIDMAVITAFGAFVARLTAVNNNPVAK